MHQLPHVEFRHINRPKSELFPCLSCFHLVRDSNPPILSSSQKAQLLRTTWTRTDRHSDAPPVCSALRSLLFFVRFFSLSISMSLKRRPLPRAHWRNSATPSFEINRRIGSLLILRTTMAMVHWLQLDDVGPNNCPKHSTTRTVGSSSRAALASPAVPRGGEPVGNPWWNSGSTGSVVINRHVGGHFTAVSEGENSVE